MIDFAGFYMPVQYKGIMEEHRRVRATVGIFDVSHMGEFEISGENAEAFLQRMTINDVSKLSVHQIQYSAMCYDDGGIVDDLLVYRFPDKFMLVVNASNIDKDFAWLQQHLGAGVQLKDRSADFSLLALQGRYAKDIVQKLTTLNVNTIQYYWFSMAELSGVQAMISRTGYTGEDGFEIMFAPEHSEKIWNNLMTAGKVYDIEPIGLGARDTLRLEVGFCLYGNDIDKSTHPLEAGLGWITKLNKGDFVGRDPIMSAKEAGLIRKLVGFEIKSKAFPRKGYEIFDGTRKIGIVTSGTFSPVLEKSIGMGYVDLSHAEEGAVIDISIRGQAVRAEVVKLPFYKRPY